MRSKASAARLGGPRVAAGSSCAAVATGAAEFGSVALLPGGYSQSLVETSSIAQCL